MNGLLLADMNTMRLVVRVTGGLVMSC